MGWKPFKKIIDNRHEAKMARIEGRTERTEMRTAAKTAAYEAGIDPNAAIADAAKSIIHDGAGAFMAAKGGKMPTSGMEQRPMSQGQSLGGINPVLIIGAILLFVFMGKKA